MQRRAPRRPFRPAVPLALTAASALAVALGLATLACRPPARPSIVVISIDTLRADRLGCYGNADGLTPRLDALASRGVVFTDATAPTPITLPSHASLFTGRYPTATGVRNNGTFSVPGTERTLAELLDEAGWATGAVIAAFPLRARFGLDQGFDHYDDELPGMGPATGGPLVHFPEREAREVTDRAVALWNALGPGPRLLWVHYFDPHAPYRAPAEFADRPSRYDAEVAYTDAEVGRLVDAIQDDDPDAIVVVAADHGEGLGDHGEKTHGVFLYQTTLHVPLILVAPRRLPAGLRVEQPVSLVDVLPTVLGLVGVPAPAELDGADLAAWIGGGAAPDRPVYAESLVPWLEYRFSELRSLREGRWKYVAAPSPELYDLREDPAESSNLQGTLAVESRLAEALATLVAEADRDASARAAGLLDREAEERLRALGYVAAGAPDAPDPASRGRDPKEMTEYFLRHDQALGLISEGRYDEGIARLRELIPEAPENFMLRYQLAGALVAAGRPADAEAELLRVGEAAPTFLQGRLLLADVQARLGKIDAAVASHEAAIAAAPDRAELRRSLGELLESAGRFAEAGVAYRAAVELAPHEWVHASRLLELLESRGDLASAVEQLGELAERHPGSSALWTALGVAEHRRRNPQRALAHLRRALELDPQADEALLRTGELQLDLGQPDLAARAFRRVLVARPGRLRAHFGLQRALLALDRVDEAQVEMDRVLSLDPSFSAAFSARGIHRERAGNRAGAAEDFRRALALDPADRIAREGLRRLGR